MATKIKKISELEHLEELTSSSNVIIEENGEAKRFSAASLGKVKTVNGVEPDENGNIEVEAGSGGGASSWNDLEDKPFYEESTTTQLADNVTVEFTEETLGTGVTFPISFSIEEGNVYQVTFNNYEYECVAYYYEGITVFGNGAFLGLEDTGEPFIFAGMSTMTGELMVLILVQQVGTYTVSIISDVKNIKTIDSKFIPKLNGKNLSNELLEINWDLDSESITSQYLPRIVNKPFHRRLVAKFEWDGDISGRDLIDTGKTDFVCGSQKKTYLCKISDDTNYFTYVHDGIDVTYIEPEDSGSSFSYTYTDYIKCAIKGTDGSTFYVYTHPGNIYKPNLYSCIAIFVNNTVETPWGITLTPGLYTQCNLDENNAVVRYSNISLYDYENKLSGLFLDNYLHLRKLGCDRLFLKSSTANSSKVFAVKVDDNGVLTATEIT